MTNEERVVTQFELSLLIKHSGFNNPVSFGFSPSGSRLKESNPPEVFELLDEIRDLMELKEYHPQFKDM